VECKQQRCVDHARGRTVIRRNESADHAFHEAAVPKMIVHYLAGINAKLMALAVD
jgi:hypothetical protein